MRIKETIGVSFPGSVERPPLEDVVALVDSDGVALGVQRAFSARVRGVRDGGSGLIAPRSPLRGGRHPYPDPPLNCLAKFQQLLARCWPPPLVFEDPKSNNGARQMAFDPGCSRRSVLR